MAGPQRIEWRRGQPRRALSNLGWYAALAGLTVVCLWLLFGNEPTTLDTGEENPLASLPAVATWLALAGAAVVALPVVRRPLVAADHYALLVRPGPGRTLALPWARIAEIAVHTVAHERYLLVRLRSGGTVPGDTPNRLDQASLRSLRRRDPSGGWGCYDLAVPMRDFVGGVEAQLTALAAFAPDTVAFAGEAAV